MFNKKPPTTTDATKELVSKHLRAADRLVKQKRYNEALLAIEDAYKLDPKNMYTRSFLERTRYMIEKENEKHSQIFGEVDRSIERRMEAISQLLASAEEFIKDKKYHNALNAIAKVYHIDPKNYYAQAFSDRIEELMAAETNQNKTRQIQDIHPITNESQTPPAINVEPQPPSQPKLESQTLSQIEKEYNIPPATMTGSILQEAKSIKITEPQFTPETEPQEEVGRNALYRELLRECWADGVITPEESAMLHRVRSQYSISLDTHCRIEVDIKIDAYVDALRIVWRDGVVNDNEQEVLEIMRKKFGITPEEQAAAEIKFTALNKNQISHGMILIVDPDQDNSISIARALINKGYEVKMERHPDDAFRFLNTHTPDLILSEVVFPQLDTDGFDFFQKTRTDEPLNQIPFLMMTYPGDARIVKAGLRMGVDYFLTKPLHLDFMVAIIEGKLKIGRPQTTAQK